MTLLETNALRPLSVRNKYSFQLGFLSRIIKEISHDKQANSTFGTALDIVIVISTLKSSSELS